jgi:hypothetical protein
LLLLLASDDEAGWLPGSCFPGLYTPSRKSSTGSIKSVVDTNDSWGTCTDGVRLAGAPRSDHAPRHFERRTFRRPRHDPDEFLRFSRTKLSVPFRCFAFRPAADPPSPSRFNLGMINVEARVDCESSERPGGGGCSDSEIGI